MKLCSLATRPFALPEMPPLSFPRPLGLSLQSPVCSSPQVFHSPCSSSPLDQTPLALDPFQEAPITPMHTASASFGAFGLLPPPSAGLYVAFDMSYVNVLTWIMYLISLTRLKALSEDLVWCYTHIASNKHFRNKYQNVCFGLPYSETCGSW